MSYFLPQNVLGIASYQVNPGDSGWFQLPITDPLLDVLPFTMPDGVTAILVQAIGDDLLYCLSPEEAALGTSAYLTLPAGSTIFLPGQAHVHQFCVLLNGGAPNIVVQFYSGDIGPTPQLNFPGTGGGPTPPGSGTVTSVNANGNETDTGFFFTGGPITVAGVLQMQGRARVDTDNALHVMVNGNDLTGTRGRLDKPFATLAEALGQSEEFDTIYVWPGSYTANSLSIQDRNIYLLNAELVCDFGQAYMFDCFGTVTITSEGNAVLRHVGGTGSTIINGNENCDVTIRVVSFTNNDASIAKASGEGTKLNINAKLINSGPEDFAFTGWENAQINADIEAQSFAHSVSAGCTFVHRGNITAVDLGVDVTDGDFTIFGDIRASSSNGAGAIRTNGQANVRVYGNIAATGAQMPGIQVENGGADIEVYGNVSAWTTAAITVPATDVISNIRIHGDITCLDRHGILTELANITVWGNITTSGVVQDANCVHATGASTVRVYGHLTSYNGAAAKTSDTGALIEVFGNAYSANRWGAFTINGGHIIINGIAESGIREGAYVEIGQITLLGGAKGANNTAAVTMLTQEVVPGNLLTLGGGCYLDSNGSASYAVDCNPGGINGVRSYGAYGNKPLEPSLVPVGTFTVA